MRAMKKTALSSSPRLAAILVLGCAAACGDAASNGGGPGSSPPNGAVDAAADGAIAQTIGPDASSPAMDAAPIGTGSDAATDAGASDAGMQAADGGAPPGNGATPTLPLATGACPTFVNGTVTFAPAGIPARSAQVYMSDAAKTKHGPLIIYWYATGSSTGEAQYSLGATLASIVAAGGIVVAPQADPTAGQFEWFIVNQSPKLDDFLVADEIVACAAKSTGIDTAHLHSMGMSAGALQTTAMSRLRSSYVASVATYSGGLAPGFSPPNQDPANKLAAFIFHGGATDNVFNVDFQAASKAYYASLKADGHFAAICNHGQGHSIPLDAAPSVALFFEANGFGVTPSPYANGLPAGFPAYCTL